MDNVDQNVIVMPDDYVTTLKEYKETKSEAARDKLRSFSSEYKSSALNSTNNTADFSNNTILVTKNQYKPTPADKQTMVTVANGELDDQDLRELTLYTAKLLDPLREQANNSKDADYAVTDNSLAYSKKIGQGYTADSWNMLHRHKHDTDLLDIQDKAAGAIGHKENVAEGYVHYSNTLDEWKAYDEVVKPAIDASENGGFSGVLSMEALKKAVYMAIVDMLFDDDNSEWGHVTNFIFNNGYKESIGLSLDQYLQIHFNSAYFDNDTSTAYEVPKPADVAALQKNVAETQAALNNAKQDKADAEAALRQADVALNNAQAAQSAAQKAFDDAQAASSTAADAVKAAQGKLDVATADATAKADAAGAAQAALTTASDAVAPVQKADDAAQADLSAAKLTQAAVQNDLDAKTAALTAVKDKAAKASAAYQASQKATQAAQAALTQASENVKNASANVQAAKAKADAASAEAKAAQTAADDAANAYNEAEQTAQKLAAVKAAADAKLAAEQTKLTALTAAANQANAALTAAKEAATAAEAKAKAAQAKVDADKNLATDTEAASAAVASAQAAADKANADLQTAQADLAAKKTALANAQTALTQAKKHLAILQALADAAKGSTTDKSTDTDANKGTGENTDADANKGTGENTDADANEGTDEDTDADNGEDTDSEEPGVKEGVGEIVSYTANKPAAKSAAAQPAATKTPAAAAGTTVAKLPQTGAKDTKSGILAGILALLGSVALFIMSFKKKKDN